MELNSEFNTRCAQRTSTICAGKFTPPDVSVFARGVPRGGREWFMFLGRKKIAEQYARARRNGKERKNIKKILIIQTVRK